MRTASLLLASVLVLGASTVWAQTNTSSAPMAAVWPEEVDSNADNMVSMQEAMMLSGKSFGRYDVDSSGDITLREWRMRIDDRIAIAKQNNPTMKTPSDLNAFTAKTFYTHDSNKDDTISRAEWDSRVEMHFAAMDANGDGMIGLEEAEGMTQTQKKGN